MPGYDRTGPAGQGAMTGRGMGPCGGGAQDGRGFGMGMGRGFRRGFGGRGFGRGVGMNRPAAVGQDSVAMRIEQLEAELQQLKGLHENSDHQR